jgi:hypothetical protein
MRHLVDCLMSAKSASGDLGRVRCIGSVEESPLPRKGLACRHLSSAICCWSRDCSISTFSFRSLISCRTERISTSCASSVSSVSPRADASRGRTMLARNGSASLASAVRQPQVSKSRPNSSARRRFTERCLIVSSWSALEMGRVHRDGFSPSVVRQRRGELARAGARAPASRPRRECRARPGERGS